MAAYCLARAEVRVRLPLGALRNRSETWDAIATSEWSIRGRWPLANLVRQPRISPSSLRWGPCWYGRTAVNRLVAGSIPATAADNRSRQIAVGWLLRTRLHTTHEKHAIWKSSGWMRSLSRKQVRVPPVVGSSPTASAFETHRSQHGCTDARTTRASGRAAKVPGFQPGQAGSTPVGHSSTLR